MNLEPDTLQWKREADRISAFDRKVANRGATRAEGFIPDNEKITLPTREDFLPPSFLKLTATAEEYAEAVHLLEELWKIDTEFTGERTREVEAYLTLSGDNRPLVQRLIRWCESHFARRMAKTNSKDSGSPFKRLDRVYGEYRAVFHRLALRPNSVAYVLLAECSRYLAWLLMEWTRTNKFVPPRIENCPIRFVTGPSDIHSPLDVLMHENEFLADYLPAFLRMFHERGTFEQLERLSQIPKGQLIANIADFASDIQEMRPFLIRNFNSAKSRICVRFDSGQTLYLGWEWCLIGTANVFIEATDAKLLQSLAAHTGRCIIGVDLDGVLFDSRKRWFTTVSDTRFNKVNGLAVNAYILDMFRDKLFSFYDKIDLDCLRLRAKSPDHDAEPDDEVLAVSCQDLAQTEVEAEPPVGVPQAVRRLPQLRFSRFIASLQEFFACEVQQGKGSEVTMYRVGGKKCVIGHHGGNDPVYPTQVKRLLRQLGIPVADWCAAVLS